jgi:glycosyltransferase involved in cell wall biosynthesis
MFSLIIPSFNNIDYLKVCIASLKKNSFYNNEIIVHINIGVDGSIDYLNSEKIKFTHTEYNSGICEGVNMASKLSSNDYIVYAHDDFYFCPNWDKYLYDEIIRIGHNNFYLSSSTIGTTENFLNCGDSFDNFDEQKFLDNYNSVKFDNLQGSTWAPHVVHKTLWFKVGGFSEEFFPGAGSDPDFNLKLWNVGVRIFKSLSTSKIYHFKSKTLRRKVSSIGSKSGKLFIKKWGFSIKFFKKHYLESGKVYTNELSGPNKNLRYFFDFFLCKINYFYLKLFYKS